MRRNLKSKIIVMLITGVSILIEFHQSNRVVLPNMKPEEFNDLVVMLEKRVMNYTIKMRSRSLDFWKARIGTYLMRPRKIIDDIYSVVKQR